MGCIASKVDLKDIKDDLKGDIKELAKIKKFTFAGYTGPARVIDVHDGDTITVVFKPEDKKLTIDLRISGIDTPETRVGKVDPDRVIHKKCGELVRDYVKQQLSTVELIDISILCADKYSGRWVATVRYGSEDLSTHLLGKKYAIPYDGKKKKKWATADLESIEKALSQS